MTDKDFVVLKINNTQEKVSEGDIIAVPRIDGEAGDKITISEILLSSQKDTVKVGKPLVDGASIDAEIVEQAKDKKVTKRTFKSKSRYRRNVGSRQHITKIKINKIKF
jgi:large subunit ribosomal protein L21